MGPGETCSGLFCRMDRIGSFSLSDVFACESRSGLGCRSMTGGGEMCSRSTWIDAVSRWVGQGSGSRLGWGVLGGLVIRVGTGWHGVGMSAVRGGGEVGRRHGSETKRVVMLARSEVGVRLKRGGRHVVGEGQGGVGSPEARGEGACRMGRCDPACRLAWEGVCRVVVRLELDRIVAKPGAGRDVERKGLSGVDLSYG